MLWRMTTEGFLASLSVEEADAFQAAGFRRPYGANVTLLHQADEAGSAGLLRGRAKIAVTESGREAIFGVVGPGDLIGELAAIKTARARRRLRRSSAWKRSSSHARISWLSWIGIHASRW